MPSSPIKPQEQHPSAEKLGEFALGRLLDGTAAMVAVHISGCGVCAAVVSSISSRKLPETVADERRKARSDLDATVSFSEKSPLLPPNLKLPRGLRDQNKYQILQLLGVGGLGEIYKAKQPVTDRVVILKVIQQSLLGDASAKDRFLREAVAMCRLDHPNVVRVHDVEKMDDLIVVVMEYLEGDSLAGIMRKNKRIRIPLTLAARYILQAAQGLQHAHELGVLHRNVNADNLRLGANGEVKVVDFGLVQSVGQQSIQNRTETNVVVNTPSFMAPEQAASSASGSVQADLYALGCTFFHLITGQPPFQGEVRNGVLESQVHDVLPPVREWRDDVPAEMEDLLGRMTAANPKQRPRDAGEVIAALKPLAYADQAEHAPMTSTKKSLLRTTGVAGLVVGLKLAWRYRQNLFAAAKWGAIAGALLFTAVIAWDWTFKARTNTDEALEEKRKAETSEQRAQTSELKAKENAKQAEEQSGIAKLKSKQAEEALQRLEKEVAGRDHALTKLEWMSFAANVNLAQDEWEHDNVDLALHYLDQCRWDYRGWETLHLWHLFSQDKQQKLPDQKVAATVTLGEKTNGHCGVAFSSDGKLALANGNLVRLWDAATGKEILSFIGHTGYVGALAFNFDGSRLASVSDDKTVRVWNVATGKTVFTFQGHSQGVRSVSFSPDGKHVASAAGKELKVWATDTGNEILSLGTQPGVIRKALFSPNGKLLATVNFKSIVLRDAVSGREILTLSGHNNFIHDVAFSPDSNSVASVSSDNTAKVWDTSTGKELATMRGQVGIIQSVAFNADGKRLATATDRTVKIWDAVTGYETMTLHPKGSPNRETCIVFNADGTQLAFANHGQATLWNAAALQEYFTLRGHAGIGMRVACSHESDYLAGVGMDIKIWDLKTGKEISSRPVQFAINCMALNRDGKQLAFGTHPNEVMIWNAVSGQKLFTLRGHSKSVRCVAYSRDGKQLASGSDDLSVRIWDASQGTESFKLDGHAGAVAWVAFGSEGKRLVSASMDGALKVWDVTRGKELRTLPGHAVPVGGVAFSNDGKYIASAGEDQSIILWNADTGIETRKLNGHSGKIGSLAFSPDGSLLASASEDDTIKIWDMNTGKDILTLRGHISPHFPPGFPPRPPPGFVPPFRKFVGSVAFVADGKRLVSSSGNPKVWLLDEILAQHRSVKDRVAAYFDLGNARRDQKRLDEAIIAYQKALALDPTFLPAYQYLGAALGNMKRVDEAIAVFRKAIELSPSNAEAYSNLGVALRQQKRMDEAITAFQKAIEVDANYALAHCYLGLALQNEGKFAAAVKELSVGHQLGSQRSNWPYPSALWAKQCEYLYELDKRLPATLEGNEQTQANELMQMASMCRQYKKSYVTAVRLYEKAFTLQPALATAIDKQFRYKAASTAVLAGCGQGAEAEKLGEVEKKKLRRKAAEWLQADLDLFARSVKDDQGQTLAQCVFHLPNWQKDPDLKGIHDPTELAKLPEKERDDWQKLWTVAQQLFKEAQGRGKETRLEGILTEKEKIRTHEVEILPHKSYVLSMESTAFKMLLRMQDPKGRLLSQAEFGSDSRLIINTRTASNFRIIVSSFLEQGTGPYTLIISEFAASKVEPGREPVKDKVHEVMDKSLQLDDKLAFDDPLDNSFALTRQSHHKVHCVALDAGKAYQIDVQGTFDSFLRIEDSEKKLLLFNDDVTPPNNLNSRLVFTPLKKDNYRLIVTSFRPNETGPYTLTVHHTVKTGDPTIIKDVLEKNEKVAMGTKFVKSHAIKLSGGTPYTMDLEGSAFDAVLTLADATGKRGLINTVLSRQAGMKATRIDFTPQADGMFQLIVTSHEPGQTGAYSLTVNRYEQAKKLKAP